MKTIQCILIICLVVSIVSCCHPSCQCNSNSNVCNSCTDPNSSIDQVTKRSCPCNLGWFTSSLAPFTCTKLVNNNNSGIGVDVLMDTCEQEIGLKTKDIQILTDCYFDNTSGVSLVVSSVSLNLQGISIQSQCHSSFTTLIEYFKSSTQTWELVPSVYITLGTNGAKTMKWPLMEIYNIAESNTSTTSQIKSTVHLRMKIGHPRRYIRVHSWDLFVHTNRNQVQTFQIDIDFNRSASCQPGEECVVIADLDTIGKVYTDNTYSTLQQPNHSYEVGQVWFAKITFVDSTYTNKLSFQNLFFKSDDNNIFNFNAITNYSWFENGLVVALPLIEPSVNAKIQINMKIENASRRILRNLQSGSNEETVQQKFTATIMTPHQVASVNIDQQGDTSSNSLTILFALFNLLLLIFLF